MRGLGFVIGDRYIGTYTTRGEDSVVISPTRGVGFG